MIRKLMLLTTRRHTALGALAVLACLAGPAARAEGTVYKCVEPNGGVLFTDTSRPGCKLLDLPNAIPAPAARRGPAIQQSVSPANFPRVDNAAQRARDNDRREILEDELRSEEKKLADLKREFNNGEPERNGNERNYAKYQERVAQMRDNLARAAKNVEALKREIASTR